MKSIKVERSYKLVPQKKYIYCALGLLKVEKWRKVNSHDGFMTDVYDGKLWKEEWKEYLKLVHKRMSIFN